jgi:hypothetical protein
MWVLRKRDIELFSLSDWNRSDQKVQRRLSSALPCPSVQEVGQWPLLDWIVISIHRYGNVMHTGALLKPLLPAEPMHHLIGYSLAPDVPHKCVPGHVKCWSSSCSSTKCFQGSEGKEAVKPLQSALGVGLETEIWHWIILPVLTRLVSVLAPAHTHTQLFSSLFPEVKLQFQKVFLKGQESSLILGVKCLPFPSAFFTT